MKCQIKIAPKSPLQPGKKRRSLRPTYKHNSHGICDTMATTSIMRNEDIRALDQTRQRLLQLTTAIQTLQSSLLQSEPLPSW